MGSRKLYHQLPSFCCVVALLLATPCWDLAAQDHVDASDEEGGKSISPARENAILREFFRRQFYGSGILKPIEPRKRGNKTDFAHERFVEKFIDRRIDQFVSDVEERLDRMEGELNRIREFGASLPPSTGSGGVKSQLKKELALLAGGLGDLHSRLSTIFSELDSKDDYQPSSQASESGNAFESEIEYLARQFKAARRGITDYLIQPKHIVDIGELVGDNMLIALHRAEKIAKSLRKKL